MRKLFLLSSLPVSIPFFLACIVSGMTACNSAPENARPVTDSSGHSDTSSHISYLSQPLLSNIYTADPAAHVFAGKIYIYPSHDSATGTQSQEEGAKFDMMDYHVLSMDSANGSVTDHGIALQLHDVPWASRQLWAPDAAFANNRYYLYFPAKDSQGIFRIGVASSDKPEGPFKASAQPIRNAYSVDPCVFKDDDGTSYLYFGGIWGGQLQRWNNNQYHADGKLRQPTENAILPRVAKLSADMQQLAEPVKEIQLLDKNGQLFKERDNDKRFFEAAWMHKYKGKYYFSYSTGDTHNICYATGDSPYGPFTYQGIVLYPVQGWTNHHSIVAANGRWWLFYHDVQLSGQTHLRNLKLTELHYRADGSIEPIRANR